MLKKILSWAAVFIWLLVIYNFSAQSAKESSRLSAGLSKVIYRVLTERAGLKVQLSSFHSFLRQGAHFFIFFVLALFLLNAFRVSGYEFEKAITYTLLISLAYAGLDEIHQIYVPGRTAELKDIFVDGLGIISGIGVYVLIRYLLIII
ncbi:VanZ family protein [Halanaerobium sp.]|uniref:VanZ family protein n=1 Tax=Halanaerobium sp. TaxID=1895664 RepID=UPI000DE63C0F|nr:VanZ family protein [Halanaerobium sp.]PUU87217.1 MAG: VanZ family protein [Halanaerobium sp.]